MKLETGIFKEKENKYKKDKQKKLGAIIGLEEEVLQKKEQMESKQDLFELEQILNSGDIDENTKSLIEKVINSDFISEKEIQEIFDKIEEIENVQNIDKLIPPSLRISKNEYKKAVFDDNFRPNLITKLNLSLSNLALQIKPNSGVCLNLFGGFLLALDKNLIKIQENTIDIKNSLKSIEERKNGKEILTFWQKFIKVLKEIFQ